MSTHDSAGAAARPTASPAGARREGPDARRASGEAQLSTVAGLVSELSELSSLVLASDALDRVVWEAGMLAVRLTDAVAACGVTVVRDGTPLSIMANSAPYSPLEGFQYEHHSGPIVTAMRERRTTSAGPGDVHRWPEYAALARDLGVRSSLVVPLVVGDKALGALSLYADSDEHDLAEERALAELVADLAGTALTCLARHAEKTKLTEELQEALTSRAVIEQAKGLLVATRGVDPDAAFALLRRTSQNRNVKLREVAAVIMDTAGPGSGAEVGRRGGRRR